MVRNIDVHKIFADYFKGIEALAYGVSSKLQQGNICLDIKEYKEELPLLLEEEKKKESFKDADSRFWVSPHEFEKQCKDGTYVSTSSEDEELYPFIILNGKAYLHRYFQYEKQIIENVRRLGERNNFRIITGGPGTGKTYGVSIALTELYKKNPDLNVALAAPTGKAAVRMNEAIKNFAEDPENQLEESIKIKLTGLVAKTIHRLLGHEKNSVFFKHDADRKLPYDVVIIDESSMINGSLMAKLLNAIDDSTSIFFLGDKDQLASVEAGSVFGDICRAQNSVLLEGRIEIKAKSWRFDPDRGIGKISKEIIDGTFTDIAVYKDDDQVSIDLDYDESLFRKEALRYREYIEEPDVKTALQKLNNIRFLCVTRENARSVAETNKKIEWILKKDIDDPALFNSRKGFYHNQPIMITKNDYTLDVFNGDIGIVRMENSILMACFEKTDGQIRKIQAGYLNNYQTAFAMTIHKSQGSEFENVVILLPEQKDQKLLTRELLYTAVTRAKERVLLQAEKTVLLSCVKREVARSSGLKKRLTEEQT